jgi:hypothetical protein
MTDRFLQWLAWHLPQRLVYWCGIRVVAYASTTYYKHLEMGAITAQDALSCWGEER